MRVMKIICPDCGKLAIIKKTNRKHRHLSDIYAACSDVECGHTFVMSLQFSHTLSPSAKSNDRMIKDMLNLLNPSQKQIALDLLQNAA